MRIAYIVLFLLAATWPTSISRAGGIPGADDPELRAAAEAWLDAEDPTEALWAIGEIAADGNVAARYLVRSLDR